MSNNIEGSGGGKGGGSVSNADVTGTSTDRAEVILGLCEGQIEGLGASPGKNIFLDDTPIINEDDSVNFKDIDYVFLNGSFDQNPIPTTGNEISSETSVNVAIEQSQPINRTIINQEINALRVRLSVQLVKQTDKGLREESINFKISLKEGTGVFVEKVNQTITGVYQSPTVFQYLIPVDITQSDYVLKVENLSDDSTTESTRNLQWLTYSEIIQAQITYKNTSLLYLQFPASLFKSIPKVSIKGAWYLFKVPIHGSVNADRGIDYSGNWDGQFFTPSIATSDPAWVVYGLLTEPSFGLELDSDLINKWDLYQISLHNNELINDGFGGTERRYSFNYLIQERKIGFEWIREICSTFATKIYWDGSQIRFWQDSPTTVLSKIVSNADVEEGRFLITSQEYKGVSPSVRVWWNDPDQEYLQVPEPVEHPAALAKFGNIEPEEFTALGEIRRGGAVRTGRRIILSSFLETEQISFKILASGLFFQPGEVIQIACTERGRQRKSGLIVSATLSSVTLDRPVTLTGDSKTLLTQMPDGTVEQSIITNSNGTHTVINLSQPLSQIPEAQATWQVIDGATTARKYRVLAVTPDAENPNSFEVVGKLYDDSKYSEIDNGWSISAFLAQDKAPVVIPVVRNLQAKLINGSIEATWEFPVKADGSKETYVTEYLAEFRIGIDGVWGNSQTLVTEYARWENVGNNDFYVRVAALSTNGKISEWVQSNGTAASDLGWFVYWMEDEEG